MAESETSSAKNSRQHRKLIWLSTGIILFVLAIDQISKFWIKLNMILNTRFNIAGDWFFIHFTENPGMAFGLEFGGDYGKLILTSFRILAVLGLIWYLRSQILTGAKKGFIICLSMITAGAAGNILDSIFYGQLFSDSYHHVADFLPEEGYAPFFYGKVVDMIYLPMIETTLPDWLGGGHFTFFRPIFNLADSSISLGVVFILLFQKRYFPREKKSKDLDTDPEKRDNHNESGANSAQDTNLNEEDNKRDESPNSSAP